MPSGWPGLFLLASPTMTPVGSSAIPPATLGIRANMNAQKACHDGYAAL